MKSIVHLLIVVVGLAWLTIQVALFAIFIIPWWILGLAVSPVRALNFRERM